MTGARLHLHQMTLSYRHAHAHRSTPRLRRLNTRALCTVQHGRRGGSDMSGREEGTIYARIRGGNEFGGLVDLGLRYIYTQMLDYITEYNLLREMRIACRGALVWRPSQKLAVPVLARRSQRVEESLMRECRFGGRKRLRC